MRKIKEAIKKIVIAAISTLLLLVLLLIGGLIEYFLYIMGFIGIATMIFCFFNPNNILLLLIGLIITLVALYFLKIK